jgi:glycerol uptake facilitator protein
MTAEGERMLEREGLTTTGVPEVGEAPLLRRLGAEFVGTLLLVAIGAGSIVAFLQVTAQGVARIQESAPAEQPYPEEQLNFFGELIGGDVLGVALAFGLVLAVLVYAFGGVSGGHFNPAVTFALAVARRFSWSDLPLYWVAQILGGIAGAIIIGGIYGDNGISAGGQNIFFGATGLADGVDTLQAILAEATITFVLMTAIMAIAVDPRAPKGWSGLIIGISLTAGILFTGAVTGGSANFARSLGPLVASWLPMYDASGLPWGDLWIYAVGPFLGAAAAALLYESVTGLERVAPAPGPGAATPTGGSLLGAVDEAGTAPQGGGDDAPNAGPGGTTPPHG